MDREIAALEARLTRVRSEWAALDADLRAASDSRWDRWGELAAEKYQCQAELKKLQLRSLRADLAARALVLQRTGGTVLQLAPLFAQFVDPSDEFEVTQSGHQVLVFQVMHGNHDDLRLRWRIDQHGEVRMPSSLAVKWNVLRQLPATWLNC